jgi:LysR family transcriptional regulator, hypochlorite-specific transcription factor HypT
MEVGWLEDYVALRELGSFTAAAERRNSSQSAFSRRIQALEAWLGVQLVDRSHKPHRFTPVALEHDMELRNLLSHLYDLRGRLHGEQARSARLRVAVQHSLSISLFPRLTNDLRRRGVQPVYHLYCGNRADCIDMMFRGQADLLICYETPKFPSLVPEGIASRVATANDELVIVGLPESAPNALSRMSSDETLELLSYPQESFFGALVWDQIMPKLTSQLRLEIVCVSAFTSALRAMALAGHGAACLPLQLVRDDIKAKRLMMSKAEELRYPLTINIYASAQVAVFGARLSDIFAGIDLQNLK